MKTVARSWAILPTNDPLLSPTFLLGLLKILTAEIIRDSSPRINIRHPNLLFFVSLFRSLHPPERETCRLSVDGAVVLALPSYFFSSAWIG